MKLRYNFVFQPLHAVTLAITVGDDVDAFPGIIQLNETGAEIMQMSCKSAVKGGDRLSDSEVASLIRQMLDTGAPPTCPHGRPVMKALPRRELAWMHRERKKT